MLGVKNVFPTQKWFIFTLWLLTWVELNLGSTTAIVLRHLGHLWVNLLKVQACKEYHVLKITCSKSTDAIKYLNPLKQQLKNENIQIPQKQQARHQTQPNALIELFTAVTTSVSQLLHFVVTGKAPNCTTGCWTTTTGPCGWEYWKQVHQLQNAFLSFGDLNQDNLGRWC